MEKNSSKKIICVFPTDPIQAYYDKGEIKDRYFNPDNVFDEIHVISTTEDDIEASKVENIAGTAKLFIHPIGKINLKNYKKETNRIIEFVKSINPQVIRAYNPLIQGWLAAKCAEKLNVPLIVSLHINYDKDKHSLSVKERGVLHFLKMQYTLKKIEPYVIKTASCVICVHRSVMAYAKRLNARKIELIYNRVYLDQFSSNKKKIFNYEKPTVIFVARLAKSKNQECLIHAIKDLDVQLLLIGDGPEYENLIGVAKDCKCQEKVKIVRSVPNSEIHKYYASSDIFAAPVKDKGVGITFLEAMASGLPAIIRKIPGEKEELEDAALMVDNNPASFKNAILEIISNKELREKLEKQSLEMANKMDGKSMEKKESKMYLDIAYNQEEDA